MARLAIAIDQRKILTEQIFVFRLQFMEKFMLATEAASEAFERFAKALDEIRLKFSSREGLDREEASREIKTKN